MLLAVGQRLEAGEGVLQLVVAQLVTHVLQLRAEGGAARMLAHHQRGLGHADRGRGHDLVGGVVLQHAILVDAALMREGVPADDRLVVLHREGTGVRDGLGGAHQHGRVDAGVIG
ncbi:hypothetical protein D3C87_1797940 [compost metagenome]